MIRELPGVNIQYPISELIVSGEKVVETRIYSLPAQYIGKDMLLIETPGKKGKFKARAVAIIRFSDSFIYPSKKAFIDDYERHRVSHDSDWSWKTKPKWGWLVERVVKLPRPIDVSDRRGIKFTKKIKILSSMLP